MKHHINLTPLIICFFTLIVFAGCSKSDSNSGLPSINNENDKATGASANDLLSANKYSSLKIEIQYMPGFQPDAAAINNLNSFLNTLISKPAGVSIIQSQIATAGKTTLNLNDIAAIEKSNRTVFTSSTRLGVYLLITDGSYSDANTLGIAYRNTSMCLLGKTIHDNSGALGAGKQDQVGYYGY